MNDNTECLFPYEHECNPARLFEAIRRGESLKVQRTRTAEFTRYSFYADKGTLLYISPLGLAWNYQQQQMDTILSALRQSGYTSQEIIDTPDDMSILFHTDRSDLDLI
jgi:hypothetical protein